MQDYRFRPSRKVERDPGDKLGDMLDRYPAVKERLQAGQIGKALHGLRPGDRVEMRYYWRLCSGIVVWIEKAQVGLALEFRGTEVNPVVSTNKHSSHYSKIKKLTV